MEISFSPGYSDNKKVTHKIRLLQSNIIAIIIIFSYWYTVHMSGGTMVLNICGCYMGCQMSRLGGSSLRSANVLFPCSNNKQ